MFSGAGELWWLKLAGCSEGERAESTGNITLLTTYVGLKRRK